MRRSSYRPADLAREHGISTQTVRNYERDGVLPPARRTPSGYRAYTAVHVRALRAYLALIPAHGYATSGEIMRAVNAGDLDAALRTIDRSHAQLLRDRETLDAVEVAVGLLTRPPAASRPDRPPTSRPDLSPAGGPHQPPTGRPERPLAIGGLARRVGVTPAALRKWERAGILAPSRGQATGYRLYSADDVRDAELAHLLRRGGYRLDHIATVVRQVRDAAGTEPLAESLENWRRRLTDRGRAMLTAAVRLAEHLSPPDD
ncbi:MerR family transcriptional regulator [Micromonospora haikouensis]|uniref:MerR family transcriptional regulator n=1 Tax=Micromonospora haikouensis TaxID=686309 RepID=UPI0033F3AE47